MGDFDYAFEKVVDIEGGYVNDPDDPGGETKFGISKRTYPSLDIKNLDLKIAKAIYFTLWSSAKLSKIDNQAIAEEVFDSLVNCGTVVKKWLQRAYNLTNFWQGDDNIIVDGIIGNKTIKAINSSPNQDRILKVLNGLQLEHYIKIVAKNPKQEKWFCGWLKRVW